MYIEQLLKERDMERLAVTRAATQAEEAERQVDMLKQELRQVKSLFFNLQLLLSYIYFQGHYLYCSLYFAKSIQSIYY